MFTRVEVKNFKSLKHVDVSLDNFHVLVGPNGSGKTTFLDVFLLMRDFLRDGISEVIRNRNIRFEDLLFNGDRNQGILFGFEASIPPEILADSELGVFDSLRYEIEFFGDSYTELLHFESIVLFRSADRSVNPSHDWKTFSSSKGPDGVLTSKWLQMELENSPVDEILGVRIMNRIPRGECLAISSYDMGGWLFQFEKESLALSNIPEDTQKFPVITWFKNLFKKFIQPIVLESDVINKPGKEGQRGIVSPDGSNLPWLIDSLRKNHPDRYKLWMKHVKLALPEVASIKTVEREGQDDMFLKIKYKEGHEVKQWMVSDGTLRLLLLTIIPYNLQLEGLFLIEEPEIGINPQAIQAVMDSLRSVYEGQVLVTTHSPEAVNAVRKKDLLIFTKSASGETQITSGVEHPLLKNWKGDIGSGVFYGAGIMG